MSSTARSRQARCACRRRMKLSSRLTGPTLLDDARARLAKISRGLLQAMGKLAHHLEAHGGEIEDHAEEQIFGDLQRGDAADGLDGGSARNVAKNADVADEGVLAEFGDDQRTARRIDEDLRRAVDDDVGGIG